MHDQAPDPAHRDEWERRPSRVEDRQSLRVAAVGDLSLNGGYDRLLRRHGPDYPFRRVSDRWRSADVRLGNLESPVTTAPKVAPSRCSLRGAIGALDSLAAAGFDCVSLANNHAMDFGPYGLSETIDRLDAAGVAHVGAGPDEASARAPVILRRGGQRVGILAYCDVRQRAPLYAGLSTPGIAELRPEDCLREIRELRPEVDRLIVQLHWGVEWAQLPSPEQRRVAREFARAGVDLIVGHHPHVLQPMEWLDGVPVFYSLGNFLFSEMYWRGRNTRDEPFVSRFRLHPLTRETGWADVVLGGDPPSARLQPARMARDGRVVPEETPRRRDDWDELNRRLTLPDYASEFAGEVARATGRDDWAWRWAPLHRRIELRLFLYGMIPNPVCELEPS